MGEEPAWAKGSSLKTEAQWIMSFIGALAKIIEARLAYSMPFDQLRIVIRVRQQIICPVIHPIKHRLYPNHHPAPLPVEHEFLGSFGNPAGPEIRLLLNRNCQSLFRFRCWRYSR